MVKKSKQAPLKKAVQKRYKHASRYFRKHAVAFTLSALLIVLSGCLLAALSAIAQSREHAWALEQELTSIEEATDCQARDTWTPGTTKSFAIESEGYERTYLVHLPQKFSINKSYPLILAFAGKGGTAAGIEDYSHLNTLPAIIVYPQALVGTDGALAWQGAPYSPKTDDVAFIRTLLDRVEGQLCIQKAHIFASGLSNGGGMSWVLSCNLSDRIAAFAMFAGAYYMPENKCQPKRPAAIVNVHGDEDTIVPYTGSTLRKLPPIEEWVKQRAVNNGCQFPPRIAQTTTTTTVTTWTGCKNDATVQNIRLHGAGHIWPSTLHITSKASGPNDSATSLLDFFMQHPLYK